MESFSVLTQAIILAVTQFLFIFIRSLNIIANSRLERLNTFWTGAVVYIFYMITSAIGINAVLKGNWILIAVGLVFGCLGADLALQFKKKKT